MRTIKTFKAYGKGHAAMDIADSCLMGGDKQSAIRWLEKAHEEHDPNLPYIACFPQWDALRSEPGFKDLLRRMNLQKQGPDRLSLRSFIRDLNQS